MSEIQSEAALEALLIKTLSKIGYEPVKLFTYKNSSPISAIRF
jgi:hypothetical protein